MLSANLPKNRLNTNGLKRFSKPILTAISRTILPIFRPRLSLATPKRNNTALLLCYVSFIEILNKNVEQLQAARDSLISTNSELTNEISQLTTQNSELQSTIQKSKFAI
jgi:hypothetical protein